MKQCACDMGQILMRAFLKLENLSQQENWAQEDQEYRKLLSDMAHDAVYNRVEGMADILLLLSDGKLKNLEANKVLHELIAYVTELVSYIESRFSIPST
jgi:hypothetical protein